MRRAAHRGSALMMALWIIAVLSIMVLSFASEAHLQTGVNVYVRERNRTARLIEPGQALGEVVLVGYKDVSEYQEGEDEADLFEDDRWYKEKRALKSDGKCTIGPILLDEENEDSGVVKIEIELVSAGDQNAINVNELYSGDANWQLRWGLILRNYCGIPDEYEVEAKDAHYGSNIRVELVDLLMASWQDWRDEDDNPTSLGEGNYACGAENEYYREMYEDLDTDDEDKVSPRNGIIPDVKELSYVRGFRDYPAVLTGGVLNPEDDKDEQISVRGIIDFFGTVGSSKINVNDCTVEQLMTIPGIGNEDEDDAEDALELAQAIIDTKKIEPDWATDEPRTEWPYKDFSDLKSRLNNDADTSVEIGSEAEQYLIFGPEENSIFRMTITGESMGMTHKATAKCYVKDKSVRYIEWRED